MDNKTFEQLSVAIRIVPRLSKVQYAGIMGVLKAYYGHAGRPGLVGGSMPRHGGSGSGSVQSPVRGSNESDANFNPINKNEIKLNDWHNEHQGTVNITNNEKESLSRYTASDYAQVNGYLRGTKSGNRNTSYIIEDIDKVLQNKQLGEDVTLYRGMTTKNIKDTFIVGEIYNDKGFVSTTTNPELVSYFHSLDSSVNVTLIIKGRKDTNGVPIRRVSAHSVEDEVLLPRDTKLLITKMIKRKKFTEIYAEIV